MYSVLLPTLKLTPLPSLRPLLTKTYPLLAAVRLLPIVTPSSVAPYMKRGPPLVSVPPEYAADKLALTDALMLRFSGEPLLPIKLLIATLLASSVSVVGTTPVLIIAELIVMLLVAASVTSAPLSKPVRAAAVIWLLAIGYELMALFRSVGAAMSSPVLPSPLMSAVVPTVMLAGSSSRLPCLPRRAPRSAVPRKYSTCLPDVSPEPPSPPCSPPRALRWPTKCVSLSAQTITLPPSPLTRASAASTTPAATVVSCAFITLGFLPCRSPPTRMVPPPASPATSMPAPASRSTCRPSTVTWPPVPAADCDRGCDMGCVGDIAVSVPATWTLPVVASIWIAPAAAPSPALAEMIAALPMVTLPAADVIEIVPPGWPGPPSASTLAAGAISASFSAFRTTRPPSSVAVCARMTPLCLSVPAKMPTASPTSVPRLTAWSAGACTSMRMPSRPRPVISTDCPAARMVAPPRDSTTASLPTSTFGAISTTSPPRATIDPWTASAPADPSDWKRCRPAMASASVIRSVDAVNPAVSTTAPAPTVMPAGFTSTSLPLEPSVPKIALGSGPTTRLIEVLVFPGCANQVLVPAATPKLCQLIAEWLVPAPFCVVTVSREPLWASVALPTIACAPLDCARADGIAAKQAANASAIESGRWPATAGAAATRRAAGRERWGSWGMGSHLGPDRDEDEGLSVSATAALNSCVLLVASHHLLPLDSYPFVSRCRIILETDTGHMSRKVHIALTSNP